MQRPLWIRILTGIAVMSPLLPFVLVPLLFAVRGDLAWLDGVVVLSVVLVPMLAYGFSRSNRSTR